MILPLLVPDLSNNFSLKSECGRIKGIAGKLASSFRRSAVIRI